MLHVDHIDRNKLNNVRSNLRKSNKKLNAANVASFFILALRQAEALQKWKEITQSVDTNYRDQIKAHFRIYTH